MKAVGALAAYALLIPECRRWRSSCCRTLQSSSQIAMSEYGRRAFNS